MNKKIRSTVTSRDVARLAGVSQAAVSRAFTPGASLSESKKELILKAAAQLNYIPNSIASSLTTSRTNSIGLIIGDTDNPFYVQVLREFISALQTRGLNVLTFTVQQGCSANDAIQRVLRFRVDGIFLTSAQISTRSVTLCHERGIPLILFNRYVPGLSLPVVRCDNEGGGRKIAELFLAQSAGSFCIIAGDPLGTTSKDRITGFRQRLLEAGILTDAITQIEGDSNYDHAREAFLNVYGNGQALPDAVFAANDIMAMAVLDALRYDLEKSVPADISVAGFDMIPEGGRSPYQLTTMEQPVKTMVEASLQMLDECLGNALLDEFAEQRIVPSRLIWRSTVKGEPPVA